MPLCRRRTAAYTIRPLDTEANMKLIYAPQSPFSRKVRAAAIELGLADRIELEYAEVVPSRKNTEYAKSLLSRPSLATTMPQNPPHT